MDRERLPPWLSRSTGLLVASIAAAWGLAALGNAWLPLLAPLQQLGTINLLVLVAMLGFLLAYRICVQAHSCERHDRGLIARLHLSVCSTVGLTHFCRHPPLWVFGLFGATLVVGLWTTVPTLKPTVLARAPSDFLGLWLLSGASGLVLMVVVIMNALAACGIGRRPERWTTWRNSATRSSNEEWSTNPKALGEWIANDSPIKGVRDDRIGTRTAALRIVERLTVVFPPTIAVVGEQGSGKSSLLSMVEEGLSSVRKGPLLVDFSAWGYESSTAAAEGVLRAIISVIGREVGTLGLVGLPTAYTAAIGSSFGATGKLLSGVLVRSDPREIVARLDGALDAIGLALVVWVEDLERFTPPDDSGLLRALLYQLHTSQRMSVVISSTDLSRTFDIEKLARYVEHLLPLRFEVAHQTLGTFARSCCPPGLDKGALGLGDPGVFSNWLASYHLQQEKAPTPKASMIRLCDSPRRMKQALRRCQLVWDQLEGEINFEETLVMSFVREARPKVFALIDRYIGALRQEDLGPQEDNNHSSESPFRRKLTELLSDDPMAAEVRSLVEFVFPPGDKAPRRQGLGSGVRDYWHRFSALPDLEEKDRDTPLLELLNDFDGAGAAGLAELLCASHEPRVVLSFTGGLSASRVMTLVELWSKEVDRREQPSAEGVLTLFELCRNRARKVKLNKTDDFEQSLTDTLIAWLNRYRASHFLLAHQVVYWFGNSEDKFQLLSTDRRKQLTAALRESLLRLFVDSEEPDRVRMLATGLCSLKSERDFRVIVWGEGNARSGGYLGEPTHFPRWRELAQVLVEAAEEAPARVLGPIARLITRDQEADEEDNRSASFNDASARGHFSSPQLQRLRRAFSQANLEPTTFRHPQTHAAYQCVRRWANEVEEL